MLMINRGSDVKLFIEMSISDEEELRSNSTQEQDEPEMEGLPIQNSSAWSHGTEPDDEIEILSSHFEHPPDLFYIGAENANILYQPFFKEIRNNKIHVDTRTKNQKLIARAVIIISTVLFTMSVLLVVVSLTMSDHIDDLGEYFFRL